ncbi:MAG: hypothetical protein IPK98_11845 [Chloracidobacterium sp.]|nr:hypothetical protein [Chloracidobacterium sp.]
MYRRPKFLEILLEIRQEMALEADYDVDLFAERVRGGTTSVADAVDKPSTNEDAPVTKTNVRPSRKAEVKIGSE